MARKVLKRKPPVRKPKLPRGHSVIEGKRRLRCAAKTKRGVRCSRRATISVRGVPYCTQHSRTK